MAQFSIQHGSTWDLLAIRPLLREAWYWAPLDYTGEAPWSPPYPTHEAALRAALTFYRVFPRLVSPPEAPETGEDVQ